MRKLAIILTLLAVGMTFMFGQTAVDSISVKQAFGGYQFYQGGKRLAMNQLVNTMKPNEQAYQQIKSAQSTYAMAMIVSYAGGFMVGWPVGAALGGGEPNWIMAGIGAGLIVVAIPISQRYYKKAKLAVGTYNSGLHTSSFWDEKELKIAFTGNGVGLKLTF
jgi:hypothetical protein